MASWPLDIPLLDDYKQKQALIDFKDRDLKMGMAVYQAIQKSKKCDICDNQPACVSIVYESHV